ncbi:MAG: sensor histidine kinase [Subdoligranulum sp.]
MTLLTLAENSVKHATRPDRPLTVQITAKSLPMEGEKLVNITVRDNGDGFPEKVMKELNSGKQVATGHYGLTKRSGGAVKPCCLAGFGRRPLPTLQRAA